MPSGLQVWDASGNLIVDITDRLARFIGVGRCDGYAGQVSDPLLLQGEPFVTFQPENLWGYTNMDISRPIFSISGQTIAWTYSPGATKYAQQIVGQFFYGVR